MKSDLIRAVGLIDNKRSHLRLVPGALLVGENSLSYLAEKLVTVERSDGKRSFEKNVLKKLRGICQEPSYAVSSKGKVSVVYRIPFDGGLGGEVAQFEGSVISCRNHLSPQDPLFRQGDISLTEDKGSPAVFKTRHGEYVVSGHAFSRFCERAPSFSYFQRSFSQQIKTQRGLMGILFREFNGSSPVERRNNVMQIMRHGFVEAEYRLNHDLIYVVESGNLLKTCYSKKCALKEGYKLL